MHFTGKYHLLLGCVPKVVMGFCILKLLNGITKNPLVSPVV